MGQKQFFGDFHTLDPEMVNNQSKTGQNSEKHHFSGLKRVIYSQKRGNPRSFQGINYLSSEHEYAQSHPGSLPDFRPSVLSMGIGAAGTP